MLVNKIVSHYRILERIGQGGLGEVFLAEDTVLGRKVALKFLLGQTDALEREQILKEARAAASLDHPYVCKVFETGEHEGKTFIVMEFLDGETLTKRLASGKMRFERALAVAIEISEALKEAHGKALIHCDLKPGNIMITSSGHVKLMDFGLARRIHVSKPAEDDATHTMAMGGAVAGTLAYMAPEQARGESLDARTDVFALGIIFFEMVAGVHPFVRNSRETTIAAILYECHASIGQHLPAAPASLTQILDRALAKNAKDRYPSAGEFFSDLSSLRDNGTVQTVAVAPAPSIAILPFEDLSPQHDQEYFCDGLAEELIFALGTIEQLRVVSRSATFRYRNRQHDLKEIGRVLNVTTILEGSVRKAANRLRIVVKLVEPESGTPIWSERYDRQIDDIFEIQDGISRAIVDKLRVTLAASESSRLIHTASHNIRAYEAYLKGRHLWNMRTEESLKRSIAQFETALAEDPDFALAYAGLADAWVTLSLYGAVRPIDAMPMARNAVDRALELKPNFPEALTSRACIRTIFDWDWKYGTREFEAAIRLSPRYALVRQWFAMNCLAPRGQFARAREELAVAAALEPESLVIATSLGLLDFFEGSCEAAIQRIRAILALEEAFYLARYILGQVLSSQHKHQEAIQELERAVAVAEGSAESLSALGYVYAIAGRRSDALRILEDLSARATTRYVSPVLLAQVHIGLDQPGAAIANLEDAVRVRSTDLVWVGVRPAFAKLRSNQDVAKLLAKVGLAT